MPDSSITTDVHALGPDQFIDEVHSFEFWFQSVEGYLSGRPYGRSPGLADETEEFEPGARERLITALCNYCVGETAALEGASGLIAIAPNRNTKIFLATQVVDEARHLEVLLHRLAELGVADPRAAIEKRATKALVAFRHNLLELVAGKDWEAALFAQNVILEAMEYTVFEAHIRTADPVTRELLEGIVRDERRHMGFGENELGRRLLAQPHVRDRIGAVKRRLDPLVLSSFEETLVELEIPAGERPDLGRNYLAAVARLGLVS